MADAEDLKSSGPKGRAGSSPALGIHYQRFTALGFHRYFLPPATFDQNLNTFPGLRSAASTARLLPASVALVYRSVVLVDLWPITSRIGRGTPASAAGVPKVWRRS